MDRVRMPCTLAALAWVLGIASLVAAHAQEPSVQPDIARILERGVLKVAQVGEDNPPVFAQGRDGSVTGFDVDLARAMARDLGVRLELMRTARTYDEVIAQVASGEADLGVSWLSRTVRRARYVLFSRPYARQRYTMLMHRVKAIAFRGSCPSLEALLQFAGSGEMLGVQKGSSIAGILRERVPGAKAREFTDRSRMLEAVRSGEIPVSLQGELVARRYLADHPAARIRLRLCDVGTDEDLLAVAVGPGRHALVSWVNVFLDEREVDHDVAELIGHRGPWEFH